MRRPLHYATGLALLSFSGCYASGVLQPSRSALHPTITAAPKISAELLQRQNGDRFMGWVEYLGQWESMDCDPGGTLYQDGDYWRCCATTLASCNVPLGCVNGASLIYTVTDFSGSITRATFDCTELYSDATDASFSICNTGFLFENTLDSNPQTNVFCGVSSLNWSYYRQKPEISSSESSSSSSTPRSVSAGATTSEKPTQPTDEPEPQDLELQEKKKEESKAWIAGAVVGPVVGLALIGAAIFFCLRRRKNKAAAGPPAGAAGAVPPTGPAPAYPGSPVPDYQKPMQPGMEQTQPGFVPYGVGVATNPNEQKHHSQGYYAPPPQSPHSQVSTSPIPPNVSPYAPAAQPVPQQQQQQWQQGQTYPVPMNQQPQQHGGDVIYQSQMAPKQEHHGFTSELEATPYQTPGTQTHPPQ